MESDRREILAGMAERVVPGAALIVRGFWEGVDRLPQPADFDDPDLATLWEAMLAVRNASGKVTRHAVVRELRAGNWDDARCFGALRGLEEAFCTLSEARDAAQYLIDRRLSRQVQARCKETIRELETAPNVLSVVHKHERAIGELGNGADAADAWVSGADVPTDRAPCIPTGLSELDAMTGGLQLGAFTVIGARPSIGKTGFACALLQNVAARGEAAAIFSLEMKAYDLQCRMASAWAYEMPDNMRGFVNGNSGNPYYKYFAQETMRDRHHVLRMRTALEKVRRLPIFYDDKGGRTVSQIVAATRRLRARMERAGTPLRLVMVDHIGHVRPEINRNGNKTAETTDITGSLLALAREMDDVAVVGLSQLSRNVEQRADKRPQLADLRESGSIEQDAACVMFLYRDEYYADREPDAFKGKNWDRNILEIIVAKQRNGPVGTARAFCEMGANAICDRPSFMLPSRAFGDAA